MTNTAAVHASAQASWQAAEQLPHRACDLCSHGRDIGSLRYCACADMVLTRRPVPVAVVRAPHGACGPEARHIDFPGLRA